MGNFKRKRPKHQRAGCLWCKPFKDEREKGTPDANPVSVQRRIQDDDGDVSWEETQREVDAHWDAKEERFI